MLYYLNRPMDNSVKKQSDNSNAPGTWPTQQDPNIESNLSAVSENIGNDPKAPYAADPMNGGISTQSAIKDAANGSDDEPNTVLELELGGTGTILVHGILSESDYNNDLTGPKRIEIYDQMRKGDATVRLGLVAVKQPLLSAGWYIKPGEDGTEDDKFMTLAKEELMQNPNFSWTQTLRQILLFCDYGNSFFEKVFRERVDGKIGWKKFAARLPKTVWRYTLQDGITPGVTQLLPTGGVVEIPQWKLMMFVNELEGSNYEGISLLRAAYKHWFYKDLYYKIDSIASERQGMGVPIIKVPPQATPQDKKKAQTIAKNMRVNEQSYIDLPMGFSVEYIDTKAKELKNVTDMVLHHDRQILKAFLAQFLDMGSGSSAGTKSLSDDQSELFLVSLKYIAKIVQDQMNIAIRELIDLNFGKQQPGIYPTLEVGGIGQVDFAQLSQALQQMAAAGVIVPDAQLEKYVRQTMDLPEPMEQKTQDPEDQQRRKIGFPPVMPGLDKGMPPGKGKPAQRMVNGERFSFGENLLNLQTDLHEALLARNE